MQLRLDQPVPVVSRDLRYARKRKRVARKRLQDNALMAAQNRVKGRANISCVVRVQGICVVALRCQEPKIKKGVSELTEGCSS